SPSPPSGCGCIAPVDGSGPSWPSCLLISRHPIMTDPDPTIPLDNDFIDRIVDGALTPGQLRAAIDRLDHEPDGWKRCAVAFLEAQCWGEALRALDQPAGSHGGIASPLRPASAGGKGRANGRWRLRAIAAGMA